jgi:hypothetical protein
VLLGAVSADMAFFARGFFPLIASHFAAGKQDLAVRLFFGLVPAVLISRIASYCTAGALGVGSWEKATGYRFGGNHTLVIA